jgi:hypothetical protein
MHTNVMSTNNVNILRLDFARILLCTQKRMVLLKHGTRSKDPPQCVIQPLEPYTMIAITTRYINARIPRSE